MPSPVQNPPFPLLGDRDIRSFTVTKEKGKLLASGTGSREVNGGGTLVAPSLHRQGDRGPGDGLVCPAQQKDMWRFEPLVPQKAALFENRVFTEATMLKWGHEREQVSL